MNKQIQLLDCTLRDGGQGLEDSYYGGYADEKYDDVGFRIAAGPELKYEDYGYGIEGGSWEDTRI